MVLLCHGLGDHRDGFHLPALADALASAGLGSLRLDFPGNGESPGAFRYANMRTEARDNPPADAVPPVKYWMYLEHLTL